MKIGIVLSKTPGYSETFFNSKIEALQNAGYDVTLYCQVLSPGFSLCRVKKLPDTSQFKWVLPISVLFTYTSLLPHIKRILRFVKLEREAGISMFGILKKIHLNAPFIQSDLDWIHFGFGTLALSREHLANAIGAQMTVSFRGFDIGVYPIKHPDCYKTLWDTVDTIHIISDDIKSLLYQHGFKDQAPVVKITPAIDVHFFSDTTLRVLHHPIQLITIARLHWKKGLNYTLEALGLLKGEGIDFHYIIIGEGREEEHLKFIVYQLGLEAHVTFAGQLDRDAVKRLLAQSDLYLQYSVQEGFCNAVLEAQAMGLLCVVSDAEGLSENVLDEQTGWVVPKRQPRVLADKIKQIINLPQVDKTTLIERAKERVKSEFNISKQLDAFVAFYSKDP